MTEPHRTAIALEVRQAVAEHRSGKPIAFTWARRRRAANSQSEPQP